MSFFVVSEMSHAEAGISGSPYACVRGILQILSPQFKEHHAQAWCFFRFGTATDGFPGLWVWPLPVADEGSSQRRRNREYADWPKGRRADDHVSRWAFAGSNPVSAIQRTSCTSMVFFSFWDCDRRVPGALGVTAASGRWREQPKAKKQGVCRLTKGKESRRPCFEVGLRRFKSCLRNSTKKTPF